jgi:NAD(P)-dependent dehydrogenase (short-subunit alcohol dehydrogenase family)
MVKNFMDLTGRVAVVVGGTSGLGRAIAIGLAEAGAAVVASGRRQELVDDVSSAIGALGRETLSCSVDISERKSVDQLRATVIEKFGRVDVLVNAAGRIRRVPTHQVAEEEWKEILDTNLTGVLRACQSFFDPLRASGRGRIINIVSLNSFVALNEVAAYAASKSGLLSLTRSLAVEWSKAGINVNAIAPGVFRTDMNAALLEGTERGRELLLRTPIQRFGKAEELMGAAVLLASDAASFINGACITVDGGFLASGVNS